MAHADQRALVVAPLAGLDADQPVVWPFGVLHDLPGGPERAQQRGAAHHGAVGKVPHRRVVGRLGVEVFRHVPLRQLGKGARLDAQPARHAVQLRQPLLANLVKDEVGKRAAVVRRGDGHQRGHVDVGRLQVGDHVTRVQPAHAVRDDVDAPAAGHPGYVLPELLGALLDAARRGHRRRDDLDAVGPEGVGDPPPVVHRRQQVAGYLELGKAQQPVREDNGQFGGCYVLTWLA